jgi:hypothetical protein
MNGRASHKQWWDVEEVARAAADCEVRKRRRPDAIAFRAQFGEEVLSLAGRRRSGEYRPEPGTVFVTERPKYREVHAAAYRDRVVQHLLHRRLEPRLERSFISGSFACRPGKGTHAARFTPAERAVQPQYSPWSLAQTLVHHDTPAVAHRRGPMEKFERVPPHKRLGSSGPERGLPIGNLTSQSLANLYLGALDCFVKRTLGARFLVRYVDDFVILHEDEATLRRWEARIREFLRERLKLQAHPVGELLPVSRGVDFVGYIVRPRYLLLRRRVLRSLEEKLKGKESPLTPRLIGGGEQGRVPGVGAVSGPCRVWRPGRLARGFARPKLARSYGEKVGVLGGGLDDAVLLVQVGAPRRVPQASGLLPDGFALPAAGTAAAGRRRPVQVCWRGHPARPGPQLQRGAGAPRTWLIWQRP